VYINRYDNKARFQEQLDSKGVNYQLKWRLLEHDGHNRLACLLTVDSKQLELVNVALKWLTDKYSTCFHSAKIDGNSSHTTLSVPREFVSPNLFID
jgi:hypothetical protein